MLKMINDIEFVERIRGTYAGGGLASMGPVYDWPFLLLYSITTFGQVIFAEQRKGHER